MITRTSSRALTSCLLCQWRSFSTSYVRLADKPPVPSHGTSSAATPTKPAPAAKPVFNETLANAPRSYGKKIDEFTPTPLSRPIGMHTPPQAGENTGVDTRSWAERKADFTNYEKHLAKRQKLTAKFAKPYFRDQRNLRFSKGKSFLSPPRLFKADLSLFFPNLHGRTLASKGLFSPSPADTTPVLEGRASVVTIFSTRWAEKQAESFTSKASNPALHGILETNKERAQLVQVHVEEDPLKAAIVRLFIGSVKRRVGRENWEKYFLVRKGISDEIRESIGLLNSKVGYTYLVDHECRIRWAGSADASEDEREGLVKGVQRLLEEMKKEGVTGRGYKRRTVGRRVVAAAPAVST